jgi:hypothetical protein
MGFLTKWRKERRPYLVWSPKMLRFSLETFDWRPGIAEDSFNKRAWELSPDLPTYIMKIGKKEYRCNILDEERGVGLRLEPHNELLMIRSNPLLSGQLIDATMITQALQLTPSRKQIIIAGIVCLLLGVVFGMSMS